VFVVTVAVLAGLVALIAGIAASNNVEAQAQTNRVQSERAELMAEAGIQYAIAELQTQTSGAATLSDDWAHAGSGGSTMNLVGTDGFRIQIIDESSRVNLNVATQDQLKHLALTDEQLDSLMDWRESKSTPRAQGAKDEYYNALSHPYGTKKSSFDSVEELLLVKGFTPRTLYGNAGGSTPFAGDVSSGTPVLFDMLTVDSTSKDLDPNGKQKVDLNSVNQQQLIFLGVPAQVARDIQARIGSFQTMGDVLLISSMNKTAAHIILDNFVVGNNQKRQGKLNANTATAAALETIPNMTTDIAQSIVSGQGDGYKSLGDLVEIPGMSFQILAKTVDFLCVGSSTFEVRVLGVAGSMHYAMEAYLLLGDSGSVQVTRVLPVSYWDVRNRWGWDASAADQVQLGVKS
jgi:general secretion pathway protein K